jgi:hypothetical protein
MVTCTTALERCVACVHLISYQAVLDVRITISRKNAAKVPKAKKSLLKNSRRQMTKCNESWKRS